MKIDWGKFATRVPVGTQVRCRIEGYVSEGGLLLENYPFEEEESMIRPLAAWESPRDLSDTMSFPSLRVQFFDAPEEAHILPTSHFLQYRIDERWLTFEELMA